MGNGTHIKTIDIFEEWMVTYTAERIQIGCENHSIEEWKNFSNGEISHMAANALKWWKKNKKTLFKLIESYPAKATTYEGK